MENEKLTREKLTYEELLNELDHFRRALNSEKLKTRNLEHQLKVSRELLKVERKNSSYWHEVATDLRSKITSLLDKYEQEAMIYGKETLPRD